MNNEVCKMLGIEVPIFAFTHCRDVVAEVSRGGGFGVLGASGLLPEALDAELSWIDSHADGKPYGIDFLISEGAISGLPSTLVDQIPQGHKDWLIRKFAEHGVPAVSPADPETVKSTMEGLNASAQGIKPLLEVAFRHPLCKLVVNALGPTPRFLIDLCKEQGVFVAALAGKVEHAIKHKKVGVDIIVSMGSEAGGHTGEISTMVLTPQIVDAVAPIPVLAAGGIGCGRQVLAALALGAQGVWCGTIWLGTNESETLPVVKEMIFEGTSSDTVQSRCMTGKPVRMLKSAFTEMWNEQDAPGCLPLPLQPMLIGVPSTGAGAGGPLQTAAQLKVKEMLTYPAGQIVGMMKTQTSVKDVMYNLQSGLLDAYEKVTSMLEGE